MSICGQKHVLSYLWAESDTGLWAEMKTHDFVGKKIHENKILICRAQTNILYLWAEKLSKIRPPPSTIPDPKMPNRKFLTTTLVEGGGLNLL